MNSATIEKSIVRLETQKNKLRQKQLELLKKQMLQCMHCRKRSQVGAWTFIQDQWYVEPFSCNEGDYYKDTKTECCHLFCPKCESANYIYNHPKKEMIVQLADNPPGKYNIFKAVVVRKDK